MSFPPLKIVPTPIAHMYPSDLERFQHEETFANAFSIEGGHPNETSVPLYSSGVVHELLKRIETLQESLRKYGKHLDNCDSFPRHEYDQRLFSEMICDCGLSEALGKTGWKQSRGRRMG